MCLCVCLYACVCVMYPTRCNQVTSHHQPRPFVLYPFIITPSSPLPPRPLSNQTPLPLPFL